MYNILLCTIIIMVILNRKNGRIAMFGMRISFSNTSLGKQYIIVCYNHIIQYKTMHLAVNIDYSNAGLKTPHQYMHDACPAVLQV